MLSPSYFYAPFDVCAARTCATFARIAPLFILILQLLPNQFHTVAQLYPSARGNCLTASPNVDLPFLHPLSWIFHGRGAAAISSLPGFPIESRKAGERGRMQDPPKLEGSLKSFRLGSQVNTCSLSPVLRRVERYRDRRRVGTMRVLSFSFALLPQTDNL